MILLHQHNFSCYMLIIPTYIYYKDELFLSYFPRTLIQSIFFDKNHNTSCSQKKTRMTTSKTTLLQLYSFKVSSGKIVTAKFCRKPPLFCKSILIHNSKCPSVCRANTFRKNSLLLLEIDG